MLYPRGRISEVQRRQMTTVPAANVHAIAIEGSFDDCQDLVKAMFADAPFRRDFHLSAVNSINWARIMAQIVYYVAAAVALGAPERKVGVRRADRQFWQCCYAAHGPRAAWGCRWRATYRRDQPQRHPGALPQPATMSMGPVEPTLSPSMDIQVSSNFERLYFELTGRSGAATAAAFKQFRASGTLPATPAQWQKARELFSAYRVDDALTKATIAAIYQNSKLLIDPHSAVALAAAQAARRDPAVPMVAVATAHPAKFPEAIQAACGIAPEIPPRLANLQALPERLVSLDNDLGAIEGFIRAHARLGARR
jgi:threonine synthase